jgi:Ice-binding-like
MAADESMGAAAIWVRPVAVGIRSVAATVNVVKMLMRKARGMTDTGRRAVRRAGHTGLAAGLAGAVAIAVLVATQSAAGAAVAPVGLGTAQPFGVLAGTTVTNTGVSIVNGDLGLSPGTAVTGFPPGIVTGTMDLANGVAAGAQADLTTAYNDAAGRSPKASTGKFIGAGQTLSPGVYNATSSLHVGGALTLDAHGNPNAVFIFQVGSTLVTGSASTILLTGGASACNVFWQVGSSATLGTNSTFAGSILALTSITVTTGDTLNGRALARNGAVTLDDDTINVPPGCAPGPSPSPTGTGTPSPSPTGTGTPSPSPTGPGHHHHHHHHHPSPPPTPTPSPTSTGSPSPSPTGTGHRHHHPSPAPVPTPVPCTLPVTG